MAIIILPLMVEDIPAISKVAELAFANDPFHQAGFPRPMTSLQHDEYTQWRHYIVKLRMAKENSKYFKAFDEISATVVGFVGFHGPASQDGDGVRWPGRPDFLIGMDDHAEMFKQMRQRVLGNNKDVWFLQAMCVHPDFQGRGIASQLMNAGLTIVDHYAKDCYVEATPRAAKAYANSGFEVKDIVKVMDGAYVLSAMLRPASTGAAELS